MDNTAKATYVKTIISVDVDGLKGVNHYTIKDQLEVPMHDSMGDYSKTDFLTVTQFDITWSEIEQRGGVAEVNRWLKDKYHAELD